MGEVLNYKSRLSDPGSQRLETFSYLPAMTREGICAQVEYIVSRGWSPAIEHTEPENALGHYWYMWKLPMFGETDVMMILAEAQACRDANLGDHVRLIGYDNRSQSQGTAIVIYRAPE